MGGCVGLSEPFCTFLTIEKSLAPSGVRISDRPGRAQPLYKILMLFFFYVHVTMHRNKFLFNKTNRRTNFPNLFCLETTCFGQFLCPSSGVFHCTFGTGICYQTCMTYTSAECTVENSWWWIEKLLEICRVSWQNKFGKLVRLLVLLKRNINVMFGYNLKSCLPFLSRIWVYTNRIFIYFPETRVA
jgi:hypothetical protein